MTLIVITSYNEPKATVRAVQVLLRQKSIKKKIKIVVVDPFPEVEKYLKQEVRDKRVEFFLDPGEGKNYALNIISEQFSSKSPNDIMVFTDGDVYVSETALAEILKKFEDEKVGCVTGRPIAMNLETTKYGYWAKILYGAIHQVRKKLDQEKRFFQCSGYLFAIRNGVVKEIPLDVPEDAVIPYLLWKKGYQVAYAEKAEVYVQYPSSWRDWVNQRVRTIKAHENISQSIPDMPRTKSFFNEIKGGVLYSLQQPKSLKELSWLLQLYIARVYVYAKSFWEMKRKKGFNPAWREEEIQSTKTLDVT